jgi:hypothetical protein
MAAKKKAPPAKSKKPPPRIAPAAPAMKKKVKPKGKMPTLGGSLMGLGGTGASGMMP